MLHFDVELGYVGLSSMYFGPVLAFLMSRLAGCPDFLHSSSYYEPQHWPAQNITKRTTLNQSHNAYRTINKPKESHIGNKKACEHERLCKSETDGIWLFDSKLCTRISPEMYIGYANAWFMYYHMLNMWTMGKIKHIVWQASGHLCHCCFHV